MFVDVRNRSFSNRGALKLRELPPLDAGTPPRVNSNRQNVN